jgi:hypothetical protein
MFFWWGCCSERPSNVKLVKEAADASSWWCLGGTLWIGIPPLIGAKPFLLSFFPSFSQDFFSQAGMV